MRYQYRRAACAALRLEADNHVLNGLRENLVFLLFREAGVLRSEIPPVKSRQAGNLNYLAVVAVVCVCARLRDDMYAVVPGERAFQRLELLLAVMVRRSSHNHHRAYLRQLTQELYRRLLLLEAPVAPYPRLMEDVSGDNGNIRALLLRLCEHGVEAVADVEEADIFAVRLRAGEAPEVQIARMQNFHH